jgi:hypothetical protein
MFPLSAEPSSNVTVWAVVSLFVQVTWVPVATELAAGLKAKSLIETAVAPPAGAAGLTHGCRRCNRTGSGTRRHGDHCSGERSGREPSIIGSLPLSLRVLDLALTNPPAGGGF